jgi:hypothetical protein
VLIKTTIGKNICFIFYCFFGILGQPQGKREVLGYLNNCGSNPEKEISYS